MKQMVSREQPGGENCTIVAKTGVLRRKAGLDRSYGAMSTVMGYLPQIEQLNMQSLDKWWYDTGVGRVQVYLKK